MNRKDTPNPKNASEANVLNEVESISTGKMSLADFFKSGVALPTLTDGMYRAILQNAELVTPTGKDAKPYVRLELKLEDRVILDNRFDGGFQIFCDHIKQQLGLADKAIPVPVLLENLKKTHFSVWVEHVFVPEKAKTYRNINYLPPKQVAVTTPKADENEV